MRTLFTLADIFVGGCGVCPLNIACKTTGDET